MGVINNLIKIEDLFKNFNTRNMKVDIISTGTVVATEPIEDEDYFETEIDIDQLKGYKRILLVTNIKITGDPYDGTDFNIELEIGEDMPIIDIYRTTSFKDKWFAMAAEIECNDNFFITHDGNKLKYIRTSTTVSEKSESSAIALNNAITNKNALAIINFAFVGGTNESITPVFTRNYLQTDQSATPDKLYVYTEQNTEIYYAIIGLK